MNPTLANRLNQILPYVTNKEFLASKSIGNEIACYIFDYPANDELQVREHVEILVRHIQTHPDKIKALHLNLFSVVMEYLKERDLLDQALEMSAVKGDRATLKALSGPLASEKLRDFIAEQYSPEEHDLIVITGVGSVWPMLRAHGLLNCLHTAIGATPLVMFYPGTFDGTSLKLFGQISPASSNPKIKNYYRAFSLIPSEKNQ